MPSLALFQRLRAGLGRTWREVTTFGIVGALAFVLDVGGYNLLVFGLPWAGAGPMRSTPVGASVVATCAAVAFSWVGNRYWTYRDRHRSTVPWELTLFVMVNLAGILITAAPVYLSRHLLGLDSAVGDNVARLVGWSLATLFRFFSYRRYVFVPSS